MVNRKKLTQQLILYTPTTKREQTCLNQMLSFVAQHKNFTDRNNTIGHVTASAWLLNHAGDKALLTHHKKLDKWLQLGGHVDEGETIIEAALREAIEESGIKNIAAVSSKIFDIDVHPFPEKDNFPEHLHFDVRFMCQVSDPSDEALSISDESNELKWFSRHDAQALDLDPSVTRMFQKWPGFRK